MDADFTLPAWSWGMTNKGHITPLLKVPAVIIAAMILHYNWRKQRWYWDQHVYDVKYNEQKKACNDNHEPNVNMIRQHFDFCMLLTVWGRCSHPCAFLWSCAVYFRGKAYPVSRWGQWSVCSSVNAVVQSRFCTLQEMQQLILPQRAGASQRCKCGCWSMKPLTSLGKSGITEQPALLLSARRIWNMYWLFFKNGVF